MRSPPRHRLATHAPLAAGAHVVLEGNAAHYLTGVLRLKEGDAISLFNREQGEWRATLTTLTKKQLHLTVGEQTRRPAVPLGLTVCFAPIKGGRLETILEKATELGASVLQPVLTQRTVVDKVNLERAEAIAREAAEQCERVDWPVIHAPLKFEKLLGSWPADLPLLYGDESGRSASIRQALTQPAPARWAILVGPEGGFTPDEFALLERVKPALGVGLGPRILRADTAVITLAALSLSAWGDWDLRPRFTAKD